MVKTMSILYQMAVEILNRFSELVVSAKFNKVHAVS